MLDVDRCYNINDKQTMDYVMRRRSTVGGALEMFSLPLPLPLLIKTSRFGVWIDAVILPRFSWFLQMSAVIFDIFTVIFYCAYA